MTVSGRAQCVAILFIALFVGGCGAQDTTSAPSAAGLVPAGGHARQVRDTTTTTVYAATVDADLPCFSTPIESQSTTAGPYTVATLPANWAGVLDNAYAWTNYPNLPSKVVRGNYVVESGWQAVQQSGGSFTIAYTEWQVTATPCEPVIPNPLPTPTPWHASGF